MIRRLAASSACIAVAIGLATTALAQTPPKKKKAAPPPSLVEENLARIGAPGSEEVGWILLGLGVALGAGAFTALNLAPRRLELGKPRPQTVQRITAVAHRSLELFAKQTTGLDAAEIADLQAFYERWLNLGNDQREYFRDALKKEGIDMAKIGDAIRFALAARG